MKLMIDIHCHILPEVDDGAKTWEIALEMCQMALRDGITHIVATPHANNEYVYDRSEHEERLNRLRGSAPAGLDLTLGCDFHFSYDNVEDALVHPERYAIGSSGYMLIELSDYSIPPSMAENMARLNDAGLSLVLTHPERNPILQRRPELVRDWSDAGCIVQVTAGSITGLWGKVARNVSRWLAEHDCLHVLATDAHDTKYRPPILSKAREILASWTDDDVAKAAVEDNPLAIVTGAELPFFPEPRS
jgi:protein-tyrosine phosphatase